MNEFDLHAIKVMIPAIRDAIRDVGEQATATVAHNEQNHSVHLHVDGHLVLALAGVGSTIEIVRRESPVDSGRALRDMTHDWVFRLAKDALLEYREHQSGAI